MLTGRVAFPGATISDTIAAILEREPDWSQLPQTTSPAIRRVLQRCLTKESKNRLRDIGDVRIEIEEALSVPATAPDSPRAASRRFAWALALGAGLLLGAAATALFRFSGTTATDPSSLEGALARITFDSGLTTAPSLSRDGKLLAYASDRAGKGDLDIWVQQLAGGAPIQLTDDPTDDVSPDFSPNGSQIVFRSERHGGGLYITPALGGDAHRIADDGRAPRFSPDGSRIAYWTGPWRGTESCCPAATWIVRLAGGAPERVLPDFRMVKEPLWSPDGKIGRAHV